MPTVYAFPMATPSDRVGKVNALQDVVLVAATVTTLNATGGSLGAKYTTSRWLMVQVDAAAANPVKFGSLSDPPGPTDGIEVAPGDSIILPCRSLDEDAGSDPRAWSVGAETIHTNSWGRQAS